MGRRKKDPRPGIAISREKWDSWLRRMAIRLGCPEHQAQRDVDAQYPLNSLCAILEARSRGVSCSEHLACTFARRNNLAKVSGITIWEKRDVDDLIRYCAAKGYYTPMSRRAYAAGNDEDTFIEALCGLAFVSPLECATAQGSKAHDDTDFSEP